MCKPRDVTPREIATYRRAVATVERAFARYKASLTLDEIAADPSALAAMQRAFARYEAIVKQLWP